MHLWLVAALSACGGDKPGPGGTSPPPADSGADPTTPPVDADGDGFRSDADCDDADELVFPGAPDVCGDDRRTDCDRTSDSGLVTIVGGATFEALSDALAAAVAGDELLLCGVSGPGVASVPVRLVGHGGAAEATIDGGGTATALVVVDGTGVEGLTIRGGRALRGGGVRLDVGSVSLVDVVVEANEADEGGGIAIGAGASATLVRTTVRNNRAEVGGGLWVDVGGRVTLEDAVVDGNAAGTGGGLRLGPGAGLVGGVVSGNTADAHGGGGVAGEEGHWLDGVELVGNAVTGGSVGGGGWSAAGGATATGVWVHDNTVSDVLLGGGVSIALGELVLVDTEISGNAASLGGGGVAVLSGTLVGGTITDNDGGYIGGGLIVSDGEARELTLQGNRANQGGGAATLGAATLQGGVIAGNFAAIQGGGVDVLGGEEPQDVARLVDLEVSGNDAATGGGLHAGGQAELDGVAIADNRAAAYGGGLMVEARVALVGSTVVRNEGGFGGGGAIVVDEGTLADDVGAWGAGADDNLGSDVQSGPDEQTLGPPYAVTGPFACDAAGCAPAP